jgi:hypothetical protein
MIVPNEEKNFKITVPADLPLAEFILRTRVLAETTSEQKALSGQIARGAADPSTVCPLGI